MPVRASVREPYIADRLPEAPWRNKYDNGDDGIANNDMVVKVPKVVAATNQVTAVIDEVSRNKEWKKIVTAIRARVGRLGHWSRDWLVDWVDYRVRVGGSVGRLHRGGAERRERGQKRRPPQDIEDCEEVPLVDAASIAAALRLRRPRFRPTVLKQPFASRMGVRALE